MFKCLHCHSVFEEDEVLTWEEGHGFDWGLQEKFSSCPFCGGDYETAELCDECLEHFTENELFEGMCEECVINSINYDDFLALLIEDNFLDTFMFKMVFESIEPFDCSEKLLMELRQIFLRKKADDMICGKTEFLDLCKKFVKEGKFIGVSEYAEWLKNKEDK